MTHTRLTRSPSVWPHPLRPSFNSVPRSLGLVPWALFPGPCSLGLVPWALFPGPCSLGLVPWALFPGPCPLGLVPWALSPGPCSLGLVPWALFPGPCPLAPFTPAPSFCPSSGGGGLQTVRAPQTRRRLWHRASTVTNSEARQNGPGQRPADPVKSRLGAAVHHGADSNDSTCTSPTIPRFFPFPVLRLGS